MVASYFATLCLLIILPCLLVPGVWKALIGGDDLGDHDYHDVNLVALRNPVRESGPPACMAKLIMLRHKINQGGHRRRKMGHTRHSRSASRSPNVLQRPRAVSWMRFGKQMH